MTDINIESPASKALRPAMLAVPLERLALSTRPSNRLEDAGISVVGEIPWGPNGILPFEKIEQDVLDEIQSAVIAFERRNLPFLLGFDPFEVKWSDQLGPVPTLLGLVESTFAIMDEREQRWVRDRMSPDGSDSIAAIAARAGVSVERVRQILRGAGARTRSACLWPALFSEHLNHAAAEGLVSANDLLQREWAAGLTPYSLDGIIDVFAEAPICLRRQGGVHYLRTAGSADPRIPKNLRRRFISCDPQLSKDEAFAHVLGYERHPSARALAQDLVSDWDDTDRMSLKKLKMGSARDWLDAVTTRAKGPIDRAEVYNRFRATGVGDVHDLRKFFGTTTVVMPGQMVLGRRLLPNSKDTSVADACHAALIPRPVTSAKWLATHLESQGFPKMEPAVLSHILDGDSRFRRCGRMDWALKGDAVSRLSLQTMIIERYLEDIGRPATAAEITIHLKATLPDLERGQILVRGRVIKTDGQKWGLLGRDTAVKAFRAPDPTWRPLSVKAGAHVFQLLSERGAAGVTAREVQKLLNDLGAPTTRSGAKKLMDRIAVRSQSMPNIRWIAREGG